MSLFISFSAEGEKCRVDLPWKKCPKWTKKRKQATFSASRKQFAARWIIVAIIIIPFTTTTWRSVPINQLITINIHQRTLKRVSSVVLKTYTLSSFCTRAKIHLPQSKTGQLIDSVLWHVAYSFSPLSLFFTFRAVLLTGVVMMMERGNEYNNKKNPCLLHLPLLTHIPRALDEEEGKNEPYGVLFHRRRRRQQ